MRALITGANGDIGLHIVNYLLAEGMCVFAFDKDIHQLQLLKTTHSQLKIYQLDFLNLIDFEDMLSQFQFPFDIVIHAAGIREIQSITSLELKKWREVLEVNLSTAFIVSQQVVRLAIKHQTPLCLIYISSIAGLQGEPNRSAYCASKHALIGLAKALAVELADFDIRVNVIAPGIIETALTRSYKDDFHTMQQLTHNIPLKKWGQPKHISQTIDLLIKNDYLTGSTLVVDGGWTAGKSL